MRLMVYPTDPLNPDNEDFIILYLARLTYGDQICSCLLECILRDIIAPKCKTDLGRRILEDQRYVDDLVSGDQDPLILMEAMLDISKTLEKFGFSFKHLITNYTEYLPDGSSPCGKITPDMEDELVFHHSWSFRVDHLMNIPLFNVHTVPTLDPAWGRQTSPP